MPKNPKVHVEINAIDKLSASVDGIQKRLGAFEKRHQSYLRNVNKSAINASKSLANIANTYLSLQFLSAGARQVGNVIGVMRDFEKTTTAAFAKFGGAAAIGEDGFNRLEAAALKAAKSSKFSARDAAGGLEFLAMAGFTADQAISALPGLTELATAANVDLATASDIASDTLGAFNLTSKDAQVQAANLARLSDVMATASTKSNTTFEQLFESFKKTGPLASSTGQSIETVSAILGKMADSGLKAEESGTAVRNMLLRLGAPTSAAKKSLDALGVSVFDSSGNYRNLIDIFGDIEKQTGSLNEKQKNFHLSTIFGARTVGAANILINTGSEALKEYESSLESSGGSAKKMADTLMNNLDGSILGLQSRLEALLIGGGKGFKDFLKITIDNINKWIDANEEMLKAGLKEFFQNLVPVIKSIAFGLKNIVGILAKYGDFIFMAVQIIAVFKVISITVSAVTGVFTLFTVKLAFLLPILKAIVAGVWALTTAMLANPIGIIIAAVAALALGIILLVKNWDKVTEAFNSMVNYVEPRFKKFINGIIGWALKGINGLLIAMARIGKFAGFDTTPLDNAIAKINEVKDGIDLKNEIITHEIDSRNKPNPINETASKSSVEINVNNNNNSNISSRQKGDYIPMNTRTNTGRQSYVPF